MADRSGPVASAPTRRFEAAVQQNRALLFAMATVVALSFRVAGLIATPWTTILLIGGSATAVAIVCWQIVRRGWHEPLGVVFDVFWIAIDIGFISVTVAVTGGARSPWMPWYLAILSAAVF